MERVKALARKVLGVPEPEEPPEVPVNADATYMGGTEVLTTLFNHRKMFVDTRDMSETPHLIADGFWEHDITKVFRRLVSPGNTVFDVGSTYGYYAVLAGDRGAETIVAVDANPIYKEYLRKNLTINGLIEKSHIEPVAIGAKKGEIELHLLKDDWNSTTTQELAEFKKQRTAPYTVSESVKVPMVSIDHLCKSHKIEAVDVLKIDIEGQEEESYGGMQKTIAGSPNLKLLIEFSAENYADPKAFFARMQKDFSYMYVMPSGSDLQELSSYAELSKLQKDHWIMLVASKVDVSEQLADLLPESEE